MQKFKLIPAAGRIAIAAAILIISVFAVPQAALAGNINGPEAGLIGQASGSFMYEGKSYVATSAALGSLRAYLSRDGIDLTADQASRAASMMYANIKVGVLDGYLVPAGSAASESDESGTDESSTAKTKESGVTEEKAGKATVTVKDKDSSFTVTKGKKEIMTGQIPVKDTGFDILPAAAAALGIVLLIPAGLILSLKLKLFAHNQNENQ